MALFLVQHGLSLSKDQDPEKGLSQKGIEETSRIAQVAAGYKIPVKSIAHSGKKRAAHTAAIFKDALNIAADPMQIDGINPMDDVRVFSDTIDADTNIMIVGHLPFMQKLVSFLTCGDTAQKIYQFQNSGIVCLDRTDEGWFIKWTLNPHIS